MPSLVDGRHSGARGIVAIWPQVPVRVEGGLARGVPNSGLDDFDIETGGDEQRGEVVAEVVEPELCRQALNLAAGLTNSALDRPGPRDPAAVGVRDDGFAPSGSDSRRKREC